MGNERIQERQPHQTELVDAVDVVDIFRKPEFIPAIVKLDELDAVVSVADGDAILMAQKLAEGLGLAVGISSGAVAHAAYAVAARPENAGKMIVAVLASHGERYLSTPLFDFPEGNGAGTPAI